MTTSSYKKRKWVVTIAFFAIVLLSVLWVGNTYSLAAEMTQLKADYETRLNETVSTVSTGMYARVAHIFVTDGLSTDYQTAPTEDPNQDITSGGYTSLAGSGSSESNSDWTFSIMSRSEIKVAKSSGDANMFLVARNIFQGLGLVLVTYSCIKKMIMDIQRENGTNIDAWFQMGAKMLIGFIVVLNFYSIMNGLEAIGEAVVRSIGNMLTPDSSSTSSIANWIKNDLAPVTADKFQEGDGMFGFVTTISNRITVKFAMLKMSAVMIIMQIPLLIGDIALYTILIEILLRKMAAPLALADIVGEGARSNGVIYLKKFAALYIRVAMCLAVAMIGTIFVNAIAGRSTTTFTEGLLKLAAMIIMFLTVTKLYTQTQNIANNVMGV